MELSGEHKIPARREVVWEALHDPEILKDCIRGCQTLEKRDERTMEAVVQAKVGPVKATFDALVEIVDPIAPERYTLQGEGKGGVAGFAKGSADVHLAEDGEATVLSYHASAKIGGKLAQLGSRLVDTTAKKYAADFFACLSDKLSAGAEPEPGMGDAVAATPPLEPAATEAALAQANTAIDSPHVEDTVERQLETEAAKQTFGGPWMWGILAFAVMILVLIALR